jgi:hypothetical protein
MPKNNLPTYAIVELLIRLEKHNPAIGDYKNHTEFDDGVMVKTTGGSIGFSRELVIQQFDNPEQITDAGLKKAAQLFQSQN